MGLGNAAPIFLMFGAQVIVNKINYFLIFTCTDQRRTLASTRCQMFSETYEAETCVTGFVTLSEAMRLPLNRTLNLLCAIASVVTSYVLFGFDSFVGPWAVLMNVCFNVVGLTEWFESEHEFAAGAFGALTLLTTIVMCAKFLDAYSHETRAALIATACVVGVWFAAHPLLVAVHKSSWWRARLSPTTSARICDAGLIANEDVGFALFVVVGCLVTI